MGQESDSAMFCVINTIFLHLATCAISSSVLTTMIRHELGSSYIFGWSFYLSVVGGGLGFVTFCLIAVHLFVLAVK